MIERYREGESATITKHANGWALQTRENFTTRTRVFKTFDEASTAMRDSYTCGVGDRKSVES